MRGLILVLVAAGCVRTTAVTCSDGHVCAPDKVCDNTHETCVFPDQLTSCVDRADGEACNINGAPGGICKDKVCIPATCGDELVSGDEVCDGATDIPDVGTCVDFAYDYGALGCNALCTEGFSTCRRLGWQARSLNGVGGIAGIWEDGADLWVANQQGIYHRHAGVWEPLIQPTGSVVWYRSIWAGGGHVFAAGYDGSIAHFNGTSWDSAETGTLHVNGIWGRSPTDVYAVGGKQGGQIFHFDGNGWTEMTIPTAGLLNGVFGIGNDVFAVGDAGTILRLVGGSWTPMNVSAGGYNLRGVWGSGPTDVFAVGTPSADGPPGIALHYDGNQWTTMALPAGTTQLNAITGRSISEVYAVGVGAVSNILFYDGTGWIPMVTSVASANLSLQAVHAGATTVYAAKRPSLFLEYAGVGRLDTPSLPNEVRGLWGTNKGYAIAVGDGVFFQEWAQGKWTSVPYPSCWPGTTFVFGAWGSAGSDVWIVGPYGNMMHRTATGTTCVNAPNVKWILDIWGFAANDIYAVGADGSTGEANLLHYNGTTWEDQSSRVMPLGKSLSGVWGSGPSDVYATAEAKLLHYNGTAWSDAGLVTTHKLTKVWGASASDVFVVGEGGAIYHYDGTAWTQMIVPLATTTPTDDAWSDVNGTGANDVWVVGNRTLLHYDGTSWSPVSRLSAGAAEAVWSMPGAVVVGGELGIDARLIGRLQ
ncbi:MAG TPA: hypothetical protein VFV99_13185 [Kofleriaceae bacterium]|nr:hypothetical protein [Kofleriaceae bacterium]